MELLQYKLPEKYCKNFDILSEAPLSRKLQFKFYHPAAAMLFHAVYSLNTYLYFGSFSKLITVENQTPTSRCVFSCLMTCFSKRRAFNVAIIIVNLLMRQP
jgi:hypothetical protein